MKENLKPCVYKLSKHNVAIQSHLRIRLAGTNAKHFVRARISSSKALRISGLKCMSEMRSICECVAVNSKKQKVVNSNRCDGVLFVERSGELHSLARLRT